MSVPITHPKCQGHTVVHCAHVTRSLLLKDSNSLSLKGVHTYSPCYNSVGIITKENQANNTHCKTWKNKLSAPLSSSFINKPRWKFLTPDPKSSKYPHSRRKCGRVVETGPKTNGKPVWISSALTVAPSVPTPAQSSKEEKIYKQEVETIGGFFLA